MPAREQLPEALKGPGAFERIAADLDRRTDWAEKEGDNAKDATTVAVRRGAAWGLQRAARLLRAEAAALAFTPDQDGCERCENGILHGSSDRRITCPDCKPRADQDGEAQHSGSRVEDPVENAIRRAYGDESDIPPEARR